MCGISDGLEGGGSGCTCGMSGMSELPPQACTFWLCEVCLRKRRHGILAGTVGIGGDLECNALKVVYKGAGSPR
jgi:hypothetical protein